MSNNFFEFSVLDCEDKKCKSDHKKCFNKWLKDKDHIKHLAIYGTMDFEFLLHTAAKDIVSLRIANIHNIYYEKLMLSISKLVELENLAILYSYFTDENRKTINYNHYRFYYECNNSGSRGNGFHNNWPNIKHINNSDPKIFKQIVLYDVNINIKYYENNNLNINLVDHTKKYYYVILNTGQDNNIYESMSIYDDESDCQSSESSFACGGCGFLVFILHVSKKNKLKIKFHEANGKEDTDLFNNSILRHFKKIIVYTILEYDNNQP